MTTQISKQGQNKASETVLPALLEFYNSEVPGYVIKAGKSYIIVQISDFRGVRNLKVTLHDIAQYFRSQHGASGSRTLAGHIGDWRQIDNLASEMLEWFRHINIISLRRETRKAGLEPWF